MANIGKPKRKITVAPSPSKPFRRETPKTPVKTPEREPEKVPA